MSQSSQWGKAILLFCFAVLLSFDAILFIGRMMHGADSPRESYGRLAVDLVIGRGIVSDCEQIGEHLS